jgi:AmmeMemoRadiSam system protein B
VRMEPRRPVVAGQFYPAQRKTCLAEIKQCLAEMPQPEELPQNIVAGIVPHAGWIFSGNLAAMVFSAIKRVHKTVDTFVLFGAIHSYAGSTASVYSEGAWQTPLGDAAIDADLASEIIRLSEIVESNLKAHRSEHSIEVQIPFIQHLFDSAKILPITVPPTPLAVQLGSDVADAISSADGKKVVCIGSTDLTHYGPRYGFAPLGTGIDAIRWAKEVNDRQFIDLAVQVVPEKIPLNASEKHNACGAGAAAATVAVAKRLGKKQGKLLAHTHSSEVMQRKFNQSSEESVGYAAIVF